MSHLSLSVPKARRYRIVYMHVIDFTLVYFLLVAL